MITMALPVALVDGWPVYSNDGARNKIRRDIPRLPRCRDGQPLATGGRVS